MRAQRRAALSPKVTAFVSPGARAWLSEYALRREMSVSAVLRELIAKARSRDEDGPAP